MNIKRLTVLSLLVSAMLSVWGVPARQGLHVLSQPDGTQVSVRIIGDEHFHYYESEAGEVLMRDSDGTLRPMTRGAGGELVACGEITGRRTPEAEKEELRKAVAEYRERMAEANVERRVAPQAIQRSFPTTGVVTGLVILCEYQDVKLTDAATIEHYDRICNEKGYSSQSTYGSVIDYFTAQSDGKFTPSFDIFGPVTLPHERAYYGVGDDIVNQFRDACLEADKMGLDFSKYDINSDGFVDFLFLVFAGHGEAQGGPYDTVWPAMQDLSNYVFDYFDGLNLGVAACSCELKGGKGTELDGVGTICHEFSHILGLADIYDTSNCGGHGMSHYDIMDAGTYNDNQITPSGYTAMDKYTLGWIEPIVLEESRQNVSLRPFDTSHEAAFIVNPDNPNEYYTLENRQQQGWDKGIPGHGLVISYCHYDATHWRRNTVNSVAAGYEHVRIVAADNVWGTTTFDEAADPFPGTTGNTAFSATTRPAAVWQSTQTAFVPEISNIRESEDGVIIFDFYSSSASVDALASEQTAVRAEGCSIVAPEGSEIYDINGRRVAATDLSPGIYVVKTPAATVKLILR